VKNLVFFSFLFVVTNVGFAQKAKLQQTIQNNSDIERPRLVVGIVVDQMRYDFLFRFWDKYGNGGFKRMVKEGFSFANCNYSYYPTYTAPGHASIYTGTTPCLHGIVGNDWFETRENKMVYCVQDDSVKAIGGSEKAGKMSPKNLQTYSVADQVLLAGNFRGKSFGVSMKDRGAILPAGHGANAAFWFDSQTGNFISSNYYKKLNGKLPDWLEKINSGGQIQSFKDSVWRPLLYLDQYTASTPDEMPWENSPLKSKTAVFPYNLSDDKEKGFEIIRKSPFGNRATALVAKQLIVSEKLGKDKVIDFLSVSFSCTDIIGHAAGPFGIETQDSYLRLDKDLEDFFNLLDKEIGKEAYLCFLTADHGILEVPAFLKSKSIPAQLFKESVLVDSLKSFLVKEFGTASLVKSFNNLQIYLDDNELQKPGLHRNIVAKKIIAFLENQPNILRAFAYGESQPFPSVPFQEKFEAGYFKSRSGDIQLVLKPGTLDSENEKGTSHGAPYSYDSHVPCLWMGWKIKHGEEINPIKIQDIAPTLSSLLHIMEPNGCTGKAQTIPLKQ
jgi:predicted AlkP superfamily pyrophosphatase or phosphodiesterase